MSMNHERQTQQVRHTSLDNDFLVLPRPLRSFSPSRIRHKLQSPPMSTPTSHALTQKPSALTPRPRAETAA
eukprot:767427-Hanusia_phi.AAC.1